MTERGKRKAGERRPGEPVGEILPQRPDDEARREEMRRFVQDLRTIARGIPNP